MPGVSSVVIAFALSAQSTTAAPAAVPQAANAPARQAASPAGACKPTWPDANTQEIVVCAERPNGYRIDPDVLKAKSLKRVAGRPSRASGAGVRDTSACAVGAHPMGCQSAGINIIGAALTAAQMAARLAKGQEIGSMFVTNPEPNEYQLYLAAKAAREAEEAENAAKASSAAKP